jgi:hypothetical protein
LIHSASYSISIIRQPKVYITYVSQIGTIFRIGVLYTLHFTLYTLASPKATSLYTFK